MKEDRLKDWCVIRIRRQTKQQLDLLKDELQTEIRSESEWLQNFYTATYDHAIQRLIKFWETMKK